MINKTTLDNMAQGINSVPCPLCGKFHKVSFSQKPIQSLAQSSAEMLVLPSGDKLFVEVSGNVCDGFKSRLTSFILSRLDLIVKSPFDKI